LEQVLSISKLTFIDVSWNFQLHSQVIIWALMGRAKQTFLIRILCKTWLVYTPKLPTQYGWSWFGAGRKATFKSWLSYCNIVRTARKDFDLVVEGDLQTKRNITAGHCFGHNEISGQKHVFIIIYEFKKSIWRDDKK
jgi:hypothetical protein